METDDLGNVRLLFVEDDEDLTSALVPRLRRRNIDVTAVPTGEDALKELRVGDFEVVVSDIKLPGMSGLDLLARVKELDENLPVILITGYADLASAREAVALNATDYLVKPLVRIEELLHPVHKAVRAYRLRSENEKLLLDLKEKAEELQKSEQQYRDLFESAGDIIYTLDKNRCFASVNRRMQEVTGFRRKELLGRPVSMLVSSFEDDLHDKKVGRILAGKPRDTVEVGIAARDGEQRSGELGMRPIVEGTEITGIHCMFRDMTERKSAEQEELNLKEHYEKVVSGIPHAVLTVNTSGRIESVNEAFCTMFDRSEEVLGKPISEILDHYLHEKAMGLLKSDEPKPRTLRLEWMVERKQGESFWVDISLRRAVIGSHDCLLMVLSDITGLRRAEREKREMEEHSFKFRKMEAIGKLAGGVAHDFKNSITPILGRAEFLEKRFSESGSGLAERARVITKCVNRANKLTRQLLTFARKERYEETLMDVHAAVSEMAHFLEHTLNKNIRIELRLDASPSLFRGDPNQIHQLLVNLALNARDAMPGGGKLVFSTRTVGLDGDLCRQNPDLKPGRYMELAVSDTGCGMTKGVLEHVFEPFFTTKPVGEGTGLGLSSVYGLVKMHHGHIEIESEPDAGTSVRIYLPPACSSASVPMKRGMLFPERTPWNGRHLTSPAV